MITIIYLTISSLALRHGTVYTPSQPKPGCCVGRINKRIEKALKTLRPAKFFFTLNHCNYIILHSHYDRQLIARKCIIPPVRPRPLSDQVRIGAGDRLVPIRHANRTTIVSRSHPLDIFIPFVEHHSSSKFSLLPQCSIHHTFQASRAA